MLEPPLLELRDVSARYGSVTVLHGVSLTVRAGEIVALIGANGAGKSTLAKTIAGLMPASVGTITFAGQRIDTLSPAARILSGLGLVPEGRQPFASLTVRENLELGIHARGRRSRAVIQARIDQVCAPFPAIRERLDQPSGNLSGGQQQMMVIARGLMSDPKLLILDEPSLGLSPALVSDIFRLIGALRAQGLSVLLSEQNARMSLALADRAYVLELGRVVLSGTGRDLQAMPEIAERYLGMGNQEVSGAHELRLAHAARLRLILDQSPEHRPA